MSRVAIKVSFDLPEGATRQEAVEFVESAIVSWIELEEPGNSGIDEIKELGRPWSYLNTDSVRAELIRKPRVSP